MQDVLANQSHRNIEEVVEVARLAMVSPDHIKERLSKEEEIY